MFPQQRQRLKRAPRAMYGTWLASTSGTIQTLRQCVCARCVWRERARACVCVRACACAFACACMCAYPCACALYGR